ncbi:hypothetical protein C5167_018084 [Papaver somniferum]|uniref:Hydroxyproline-rich glycoprotein family protein n=1 Tax=Papaver somniferum TaxID=3469 RepID=A0A4Y7ING4_PAPSO|nr:uncharacterized protein At5g65660-like [Papaver somniferum]RZC49656.1 hypothetical protein C5167_018084 [Papaver somniferum]
MENREEGAYRPSLGFPLGTASLLILIFSMSGLFSCCYHWDKFRSLRRSFSRRAADHHHQAEEDIDLEANSTNNHNSVNQSSSSKPFEIYPHGNQNTNVSMPVIMPGDNIAKFIALPCPCEPFRPDNVVVTIKSMQQTPLPPPPPPRRPVYNHACI